MKSNFKDIDDYLNSQTAEVKAALQRIRSIITEVVPAAEECISYGMPAFSYHGQLVYFAAFKDHCSFFPGGGDIIDLFGEQLKDFKTSKGTIQFTIDQPIATSVLKSIINERKLQNEAKVAMKKNK